MITVYYENKTKRVITWAQGRVFNFTAEANVDTAVFLKSLNVFGYTPICSVFTLVAIFIFNFCLA
jgi:hypothetical protein